MTSRADALPPARTDLSRLLGDKLLAGFGILATLLGLVTLGVLLFDVFRDGFGRLSWQFLTSFPSRRPAEAGIYAALIGSLYVIALTAAIAIPVGIAAALHLEEYADRRGRVARLIEINIANLAGVPSIIYGLLGLGLFVRSMGMGRKCTGWGLDTRVARAASGHPGDPRSTSRSAGIAPRGLICARRDEMADDLASGSSSRIPEYSDGPHPGTVARDWRDGALDHDWGAYLRAIRPDQHLVAVHGPSDPGVQLGFATSGGILGKCRSRHHRPPRRTAGHERDGHCPPRSTSEVAPVNHR